MANGQETGIETLRAVIARQARRNDWNSVRDFHQGQRSATAIKGRIHDRTPTRLPKHQKALAERGPSIHDSGGLAAQLTACSRAHSNWLAAFSRHSAAFDTLRPCDRRFERDRSMDERRAIQRSRTLLGGKIVFNGGRSAFDCKVRNLTD